MTGPPGSRLGAALLSFTFSRFSPSPPKGEKEKFFGATMHFGISNLIIFLDNHHHPHYYQAPLRASVYEPALPSLQRSDAAAAAAPGGCQAAGGGTGLIV